MNRTQPHALDALPGRDNGAVCVLSRELSRHQHWSAAVQCPQFDPLAEGKLPSTAWPLWQMVSTLRHLVIDLLHWSADTAYWVLRVAGGVLRPFPSIWPRAARAGAAKSTVFNGAQLYERASNDPLVPVLRLADQGAATVRLQPQLLCFWSALIAGHRPCGLGSNAAGTSSRVDGADWLFGRHVGDWFCLCAVMTAWQGRPSTTVLPPLSWSGGDRVITALTFPLALGTCLARTPVLMVRRTCATVLILLACVGSSRAAQETKS